MSLCLPVAPSPRLPVTPSPGGPTEALLVAIWQRQWLDGRPLVDSSGRALRVVYPGRRWGGPGPDFQGAVLALEDGALLRGDVEVHLRASDWGAHGHGRDPGYNRTILHVVLHAGAATARQDGVSVPVLELSGRLTAPLSQLAARLSCESGPHHGVACLDSLDDLVTLVDRAGLERFFEKAAGFEAELEVFDPAEALYRGTLVALGYTANKQVCGRLAELLPWGLVRGVAREPDGEALARALLLGAAGLLPGPRGIPVRGPEPRALEQRWRGLAPELGLPPLKGS